MHNPSILNPRFRSIRSSPPKPLFFSSPPFKTHEANDWHEICPYVKSQMFRISTSALLRDKARGPRGPWPLPTLQKKTTSRYVCLLLLCIILCRQLFLLFLLLFYFGFSTHPPSHVASFFTNYHHTFWLSHMNVLDGF